MLINVKEILVQAREGHYAVGAFNTVNIETTRAILLAARETQSPVVVQMTEKTWGHSGERAFIDYIKELIQGEFLDVSAGIHLDHGKSVESVLKAIEMGFPSVMYDGSRLPYEENVAGTRKVIEKAQELGIPVQVELGNVPYIGEVKITEDAQWDPYMTDPDTAHSFMEETGADILAVAIGNAHGMTRERSVPDFERLEKIRGKVTTPIVLHGASDWEEENVQKVIDRGVSCFNVDTALRVAFLGSVFEQARSENPSLDIRSVLGLARDAAQAIVVKKMKMFMSEGKA